MGTARALTLHITWALSDAWLMAELSYSMLFGGKQNFLAEFKIRNVLGGQWSGTNPVLVLPTQPDEAVRNSTEFMPHFCSAS